MANVAHLFSPGHNLQLLRRAREAALPATRLLLVDCWTDASHTQPVSAALCAGEFLLAAGEGDVCSMEEAQGWLAETGWRFVEHKPLAGIVQDAVELAGLVGHRRAPAAAGPDAVVQLIRQQQVEHLAVRVGVEGRPRGSGKPGSGLVRQPERLQASDLVELWILVDEFGVANEG